VILGRAVASGLAVLQGVIDGVHDGGVLVSDVHSNDLVSLVDHLGGGEVVSGQVGVLASGPLNAGELLLGSRHEHHEAHASGHISRGHGNALSRPPGAADREKTKAEDEGLEDQEDQEVGEVEEALARNSRAS